MAFRTKEESRLDEFCKRGNLEEYRKELRIIFSKIDNEGCIISPREDCDETLHQFPNEEGICRIRIYLKSFVERPIEAIWVILHEFGHHRSGHIEKSKLTNPVRIVREKQAWELARKELLLHPMLAKDIVEFDKYATDRIDGYYRVLGVPKS